MILSECISSIKRYYTSENCDYMPRIVNVDHRHEMVELIDSVAIGDTQHIDIAAITAQNDMLPTLSDIYDQVSSKTGKVLYSGVSTIIKLMGQNILSESIRTLLGMNCKGRVVILLYRCGSYLLDMRRHPKIGRQILCVDDEHTETDARKVDLKVLFAGADAVIPPGGSVVDGLTSLPKYYERDAAQDLCKIYVKTKWTRSSFPTSMISVDDVGGAFDAVAQSCTHTLDARWGSEDQWRYAVERMTEHKSFDEVLESEFSDGKYLDKLIGSYHAFAPNIKWLYFIALKLFGVSGNDALKKSVQQASSEDELVRYILRYGIDDQIDVEDERFWMKRAERKQLLEAMKIDPNLIKDHIREIGYLKQNAIYMLTDLTVYEKEQMLRLLCDYSEHFDLASIKKIMEHLWPALSAYLSCFDLKHPVLNDYFEQYRYQKVTNKILPQFIETVNCQAHSREYNKILPPRSSKIDVIDKSSSHLVFFDALGAEFIGYVIWKAAALGMNAAASPCRAELPTITMYNKGFIQVFEREGISPTTIRGLDEIKHNDDKDYNYNTTKLPVHLIKELKVIDDALDNIHESLVSGTCSKVIIVSDHGASRLAVIKEDDIDTVIPAESKGRAGGRFCEYSEEDETKVPYAAREKTTLDGKEWLVLANYSRFKGGRKASVETHGGATLEEVVVPIFEITLREEKEYHITVTFEEITVSFKEKAAVEFYSDIELRDVSIKIDDKIYYADPSGDLKTFIVQIPDIKKAGEYTFDVIAENTVIQRGLKFTIKSRAGSVNRDLL